jgi:GTP-dependent phosphoenolpyruvate carboxykinase
VFEVTTVTLLLPDARTGFTGNQRRSGKRTENITHPNASYTLKYEWELVQ